LEWRKHSRPKSGAFRQYP